MYVETYLAVLGQNAFIEVARDDVGYVASRWCAGDIWSDWSLITGPGAIHVSVAPEGDRRALVSVLSKDEADPPIGARTIYEITTSGCHRLDL
jgi:hypothetical protein